VRGGGGVIPGSLLNDDDTADGALGRLLDAKLLVQLVGRVAEKGVCQVLLVTELLVRTGLVAREAVYGVTGIREGGVVVPEEAGLRGALWGRC